MGTFSLNIGTIIEATNYPLNIQSNFDSLLDRLRDNEERLIDPRDLRDSILSIWENITFKQTNSGVNDYIGFSTLDPSGETPKKKIFIGKRSFSGTQSYTASHDIMNATLLNSDTDIFLYNTKLDTVSNNLTRISLLTSEKLNLYTPSPYFQTEYVSGVTPSLALSFVSQGGNVNLSNSDIANSPTFSLNAIPFPSIMENSASASDSTLLVWRDGKTNWEQLAFPPTSSIGNTYSEVEFYGNPVTVNGYSLELDTTDYMPVQFGGLKAGTTFSNAPIIEVLRRILYPYLGPLCTISVPSQYVEIGTSPNVTITYTIAKRTENTLPTILEGMTPAIIPAITTPDHVIISGSATGLITNSVVDETPTFFRIKANDGTGQPGSTSSATTFIQGIYPYFAGVISGTISYSNDLLNLTKIVEPYGNKDVYLAGIGNVYFIYDATYPDLTQIYDENDQNVFMYFTKTVVTFSSPQSYWVNRQYKVYRRTLVIPIGPPNPPSGRYQFKY